MYSCETEINLGVDEVIKVWMDVGSYPAWAPHFLRSEQLRGGLFEEGSERMTYYAEGDVVFEELMTVEKNDLPREFLGHFEYRYPHCGGPFVRFRLGINFYPLGECRTSVGLYWEYLLNDDEVGGAGRPTFDQTGTIAFEFWLRSLKTYAEERVGLVG